MEDQRPKTQEHIEKVKSTISNVIFELRERAKHHDMSKLNSPEREIFDEYTPKLRDTTYGSDEYRQYLEEMKLALDHHYVANRHHPEHFLKYVCNGCFEEFIIEPNVCHICGYSQFQAEVDISQMNLIDIIEMLCDWRAATLRHSDGNIVKSIEINQKRFGFSDELAAILLNTLDVISPGEEGG